jgi:hypothetical protein
VQDLKARFERHQPFVTGQSAPEREPLPVLEGLWNVDKHRCIHFARVETAIDEIEATLRDQALPLQPGDFFMHEFRAVNESAPLARFQIVFPADLIPEVKMHSKITAYVALEKGPPAFGEELFKLVDDLTAATLRVVHDFADELGPDAI